MNCVMATGLKYSNILFVRIEADGGNVFGEDSDEKSYMEDESDDFDFWLKFWLSILEQRFELRGQTLGLVKSYTKDNQRADIIYN